jgi:hypothetical protein
MFELSQLYLQLPLMRAGPLSENVENHSGTVKHPALEFMLNISFLAGAQSVIEQHNIGIVRRYCITNLFQLALTNEKSRTGLLAGAGNGRDRLNTGRGYQFPELTGVFGAIVGSKVDVDEDRALTDIRTFKQLASTPG